MMIGAVTALIGQDGTRLPLSCRAWLGCTVHVIQAIWRSSADAQPARLKRSRGSDFEGVTPKIQDQTALWVFPLRRGLEVPQNAAFPFFPRKYRPKNAGLPQFGAAGVVDLVGQAW